MIPALFVAAVSASAFGIIDVDQHGRGGGLAANRIGLRGGTAAGSNDLRASYWLETGVAPATGRLADPRRVLSRRSTVSLASPRFGELRMGRDFTPGFLGYSYYDAFAAAGIAAMSRVVATGCQGGQLSYLPPAAAGAPQWQISSAPGRGMAGVRVRYVGGAFDGSLAWQRQRGPNGTREALATGGLAWRVGQARLLAAFSRADQPGSAIVLGGQVQRGRDQWRISWIHADGNQLALGLVHTLSPKVALYATVASDRGAQVGLHQQF